MTMSTGSGGALLLLKEAWFRAKVCTMEDNPPPPTGSLLLDRSKVVIFVKCLMFYGIGVSCRILYFSISYIYFICKL